MRSILSGKKMESFQPDVLFNLVEQFKNNPGFDQNIVSLLEMQGVPFTGLRGDRADTLQTQRHLEKNPGSSRNSDAELRGSYPRGQRIGGRGKLKFPILVKPVKDEASYGISRASFVQNEEQFRDRIRVHSRENTIPTRSPRNTSRAVSFM